ncbi:syntaxin-6 isoform X1 [Bradysia coprophila]|uniref:syntaxin-6 isoform X1 n=2 Tax=Bradysia coprophila TaxID=38358 RepID=UPI00187D78E5|nr:syntaxin-6 isoform X1 [Bradysia coprophila]
MSLEDPFFVVKDEVFKALNKTRGLYLRWREIGDTTVAESEWTTTELRNSLRSIEWDLEDLEDTITIVEKNPNKFKIDKKELISRRCFIDATRDEVKSMKEKMSLNRNRDRDITARQPLLETVNNESNNNQTLNNNSSGLASTLGTMASRHSGTKYSKLENAIDSPGHYSTLDSPSHRFIGESVSVQQRMLQGQDEQLDVISDSIGTLKTVSRQIGIELDEQAVMLDDFGNELESTESKIDSTMKKVAKVLHMNNDNRQWMAIIVLSILLLLVIVLFIVL